MRASQICTDWERVLYNNKEIQVIIYSLCFPQYYVQRSKNVIFDRMNIHGYIMNLMKEHEEPDSCN